MIILLLMIILLIIVIAIVTIMLQSVEPLMAAFPSMIKEKAPSGGGENGVTGPEVGEDGKLIFSPRVEVDLSVHEPHLNKCLSIMANWDTAPLLHLAKPKGQKASGQTRRP